MNNQILLQIVVFILLSMAIFLFLDFGEGLRVSAKQKAKRKKKRKQFKPQSKAMRALFRFRERTKADIAASPIPNYLFIPIAIGCSIGGFMAGKVVFSSRFLAVFVAVLATLIPFIVMGMRKQKTTNRYLNRLASSMMVLSNSYLITEDFIASVKENLSILEYPQPFREFLSYATMMDSDVTAALRRMGNRVQNPYFTQWVDVLCLSQKDRSLRFVCVSVVDSFHDLLQAQEESDAAMSAVWNEYLITIIMIFCIPLVFKVLLADAYITMTHSVIGQGLMVLLLLAVVFSVFRAIKLSQPKIS